MYINTCTYMYVYVYAHKIIKVNPIIIISTAWLLAIPKIRYARTFNANYIHTHTYVCLFSRSFRKNIATITLLLNNIYIVQTCRAIVATIRVSASHLLLLPSHILRYGSVASRNCQTTFIYIHWCIYMYKGIFIRVYILIIVI